MMNTFTVEQKQVTYLRNIDKAIYKRVGPVKKLFSLGVTAIKILPNGDILVGTGEGKLAKISIQTMQLLK